MPNLSNTELSPDQRQFVEDIVALITPWGMPQMSARIYGYLLLDSGPVSLDQISSDLEISKSTASVAARTLENHMLIKRRTEKGSKRIFYVVSENSTGLISAKSYLLGEFGRLLESRANTVARGNAAKRLKAFGNYYLSMQTALDTLFQEINANNLGQVTPGEPEQKQN